jgi:hypothetical protein
MSQEPLEPLEPDLAALLDAERREHQAFTQRWQPPADAADAVWRALGSSVAAPAAGAVASGALAGTKLVTLAAVFSLGAGAGAGATLAWHASTPAVPPVVSTLPMPVPVPVVVGPAPSSATPVRPPVVAPDPTRKPTRPTAPDAPGRDATDERALIDMARSALARRQSQEALRALATHRQRFVRGPLAEERAALEVMALAMDGQAEAARDAAARFGRDHPDSLFSEPVKRAVAPR